MIKEYERELNELQEGKLISKEDLHEGDEIIYNGEHYFVTLTDTGTDFVWITDDESERYNRNAQGWTIKADWIDKVIRQPDEDGQGDKMNKSIDFTDEAEIRKQLAKYSGQYLTITFKGSEDWKHISDLLDESINSDEEEEEELALDKLEASYRREYDLLKSLEVEEISEIVDYTSYVIVTIKVEKDNLLHNFSDNYLDFIHMPSIDTDTIKILELDKPTVQNQKIIKEDINMTRKEMIDWIEDHWNDTAEHGEWLYSYLTELGFNVEDDSDDEEGFYANLTTGDLRKIIDELKPNTKSAVKDQIADIREALKTLGRVSDVSLDYTGAEEATFDVNLKDGDTFRIQIYKM